MKIVINNTFNLVIAAIASLFILSSCQDRDSAAYEQKIKDRRAEWQKRDKEYLQRTMIEIREIDPNTKCALAQFANNDTAMSCWYEK